MAIVSSSIPNLINGVSQQPFALRLASQGEAEENGYNSVVDGLTKRPHTAHVAKLLSGNYESAYIHIINRDLTERYTVVVTDGAIKVYDFEGDEKTVTFEDAEDEDYLESSAPAQDFSMVTIADYTFLVNKTVATALDDSSIYTDRNPEAMVWVRQGNYSTEYKITLDSTVVKYRTPEADIDKVRTDYIAEYLADLINNGVKSSGTFSFSGNPSEGETITLNGTVWTFRANASALFTFSGNPANGDSIKLGPTTWYFVTTPSAGAARQIQIGATLADTLTNAKAALDLGYSVGNSATPDSSGSLLCNYAITSTTLKATYRTAGVSTFSIGKESSVITISGSTVKFRVLPTDLEVGSSLSVTIANMVEALNSATDTETAKVSFQKYLTDVEITYRTGGTAGNSFAIAENSTVITLSGATLTGGAVVPFEATTLGSSFHITKDAGTDFTIDGTDSYGDQSLVVVKDMIQDFEDLPPKAVDGFQVEVTGSPSTSFDNYFVKFDGSGGNTKGVWLETPQPGRKISIDPATMFHALVRNPDGNFTFKKLVFGDLVCGDEETSPYPSFIGNTINDIFFFRNRLGLLSDENVILSRAGSFFNFFRQTVTDVLDDDPIDTASLDVKVSILRYALPFNESLLLFSDQTQFVMSAADILTPRSVRIDQTTRFQADLTARPVGAGRFVYFCTNKGGFTGIREYYVEDDSNTNDATDVTDHVPRYIVGTTQKLTVATNENIMVALANGSRNELYAYQYYIDNNGNKVQSSWSKWVFPVSDKILNCEFIETTLWIVVQRADGLYLDKVEISSAQKDIGLDYKVLLDRRVTGESLVSSYDAGTKRTTFTLPYQYDASLQVVASSDNETYPGGYLIPHTQESSNQLSIKGDCTEVFIGRKYNMKYEFSPLIIRQEAPGGGLVATTEGRTQISKVLLNYADTGYFKVTVIPLNRPEYQAVFNGQVLGSSKTMIGSHAIQSGKFEFSVRSNNLDTRIIIENDTHFPCRLLNADWIGQYVTRSLRLS